MNQEIKDDWRGQIEFQDKYKQSNPISRLLTGRFLDRVAALAGRVPAGGVLDAGCGEGITLRHLSLMGRPWKLHGIEIDPHSLAIARRLTPAADTRQGSIYELPFPDGAFDLVLCTEVMEHLEEPARAMESLWRVARGHVILSVPREPLWRALNLMRGKYAGSLGNTPGHIQHWSRRAFCRLASQYFQILEVSGPLPWTVLWAQKSSRPAARAT